MYHSIIFGDGTLYPAGHPKEGQFAGTNTWDDWHLIPSSRPSVATAGVATNYVTIPGRDGSIDMTTFLVNRPVYSDRSGSWEFIVDNDHEYWETIRQKIMTFLHGKRMKFVLEDDPNWYWEGRFTVDSWNSEASNSKITINYTVGPYKKRIASEGDRDIIWDTFNFETDDDYYAGLGGIELDGGDPYELTLTGYDYPSPVSADVTVESGDSVSITFNGTTTTVSTTGVVSIGRMQPGANSLSMSGTGTVTIYFTGGSL